MSQFVGVGSSGCLLPILIIFNFLFGKSIFGSTRVWLGIEVLLILIFFINIKIMTRKIRRQFGLDGRGLASHSQKSQAKVVDIAGQVVEEEKRIK